MRFPRPERDDLAVATAVGLWAAFFLLDQGAALLTAPLLAVAVLPLRSAPVAGGLAVLGVTLLQWALGVQLDDPCAVAAILAVAYRLGRSSTARTTVPLLTAFAVVSAVRDSAVTGIFVLVLLAGVWCFGWLVRHRTAQARATRRLAADLAADDPAAHAARVVADERARLAGEVLGVVRAAVHVMAHHTEQGLDLGALARIQGEGRRATTELRRLLGLLRTGSEPAPDAAPPRRRSWPVDAGVGLALVGMAVVEGVPRGPASLALAGALAATVVLRRADPTAAALLAVAAPAVALGTGVPLVPGAAGAVAAALVVWSVATRGHRRGWVAATFLSATLTLAAYRFDPGNEALPLAVLAVAAVGGHLWGAGDRAERAAAARARSTRAQHAAVAARAVREERLRIARDLHDVASHAVGVMVLQAGAAEAWREREPDRARAALDAVRQAGASAVVELDVLFGLLDAGALASAGLAGPPQAGSLHESITELAGRLRGAGLDVHVTFAGERPADPALDATAFRIAQEALTNVARHAPGSRADIAVHAGGGSLHIEIRDDGPGDAPGADGFGLVGLAERVRAFGGELVAGPCAEGGFAVRATLPIGVP